MRARPAIRKAPTRSGIYKIVCRITQEIYVGSTVCFRMRWQAHHRDLKRGTHANPRLQRAWNRYGANELRFVVLEFVPRARLLAVEKRWIDHTRRTHRGRSLNIQLHPTSPGLGHGATWHGFRDPTGNAVTIINLADFCRVHSLDFPSMHRLAKGVSKLKSYKGWTHKNSRRRREFIKMHVGFVDPGGNQTAPIRNLAQFCRERKLDATHMVALKHGRIVSYRGWTHGNSRPRSERFTHLGFVSPRGVRVKITDLAAFCRRHQLSKVHMYQLKSGKRPRHKGWTWKAP
ncbi:MAG: GIY-YIG nuclease family protein [Proteobacteria bacterium]|nr:GIY-YIG nuclease family protein [Pseudomonadota bacterium]